MKSNVIVEQNIQGFLLLNKPVGLTSFSCIRHLQRILGKKIKIGHAGTLDKWANGLLIVGIGRPATREFVHLLKSDKVYRATGKLGIVTSTLDTEGTIVQECPYQQITESTLKQAIQSFGTEYEQIPPLFSALQYQGKRLYELALRGIDEDSVKVIMEKKRRIVRLYHIKLIQFLSPLFTIEAHVSHGTYIRSLINDIAKRVDSCATTVALQRTEIGPFLLSQAVPLNELQTVDDIKQNLMTLEQYLSRVGSPN